MPPSPSNSSSAYSFNSVPFTRGDEQDSSESSSSISSPSDVDFAAAVQRQGEVTVTLRVLPFLQVDGTVLETADDEYYLVPCYAKRVILRCSGEQFALRIADVRVEEVEMRLGVAQGGGRLAIEFNGRSRWETVVLKDPKARIWKELERCTRATVDVRSAVLVMREDETVAKKSKMRAAVRSVFSKATAR